MPNAWWENDFLTFDTESTDKDVETARIVTSCIARIDGNGKVIDSWEVLINPGVDINPAATEVHGITNEMAADGQDPVDVLPKILGKLSKAMLENTPIVAFNARFDFTLLDRELRRHTSLFMDYAGPVLDPYVMDKYVDQYRKGSRKLGDMCTHYGIELENAHNAAADAIAAGHLARNIVRAHKGLQIPLKTLHRAQNIWAAQQAVSLERYLRRQDPDIRCEREWPLVPFKEHDRD